ncbi:MAG TPA: alpha/beta hydrolase-fold protein [Microlunatus sp.]|nr:alpha/beta hydrolase-fold protein [Microlunatus sp.]
MPVSVSAGSVITLTSPSLLWLVVAVAVIVPVIAAIVLSRRRRRPVRTLLAQLGAFLAAQLIALCAAFLWLNDDYSFYSSWSDLLGRTSQAATINTDGVAAGPGSGRYVVLSASSPSGPHQILAWLPPQYDQPDYRATRFPVVLVLPGQPSTPQSMAQHFDLAAVATRAIATHQVAPFIAVVPPLMVNPPRDTECTDVSGGPQAQTWLSRDVPQAVVSKLRTQPPGRGWSIFGWSTGAFCAAKLLLLHPGQYAGAAALGGYFQPLLDKTTGSLFGTSRAQWDHNSPLWLYQHHGLGGDRMLVVSGRQDRESWPQSEKFLAAASGDPGVSSLAFPSGGHNYRNYRSYLPAILHWLVRGG